MLLLCVLAATVLTVNSVLHTSDDGVRIIFESSTILRFSNNAALSYTFNDLTSVRSTLVEANFFKGFCEAQDLLTPFERSRVLLSTRKLLLPRDRDGKKFHVHVQIPIYDGCYFYGEKLYSCAPSPSSNSKSFRISAWGAKRFMPCGVLLINFPSEESYNNFFHNKSAFYEDLCHLESKCFPAGTYLPLTSSASFDLERTGYNQQAMIIHEKIMIDGIVSEIIDAHTLLMFLRIPIANPHGLACIYAKRSLCNYGLAGRSAVLRYLPSLPPRIDFNFFHKCSVMFNNTVFIDFVVGLPRHNKIYVHPEIIVVEPLTDFEDHLVSISEFMRDIRVIHTIHTIAQYQFPILISLIIFFIITCCLKKQLSDLTYTVLTYCFKFCLFVLIFLFIMHLINVRYKPFLHKYELTDLVYAYVSFPVSIVISIIIYHYLLLKVLALPLLLKVNNQCRLDDHLHDY